ncbi:MAG TPA: PAS domain-containing sensor histidine kinase, partial [Thermodesulfobacteriota bacterium]|nr:PAS domain-containing sensor histidine kinase [Thermodesulfobacteriota bacterium]
MAVNPDANLPNGQGKGKDPGRRRREIIIIFSLLGVVGFLFFFQTHFSLFFPTWRIEAPFPNNLLVVLLIGLNILLLLLLVFLILRHIVKLIFERKRQVLGAKLKTKLVVSFITVSLVPTILLFFIASHFITTSIDNWFSGQVEGSLQESLVVAQVYYQDRAGNALFHARQISQAVTQKGLLEKGNHALLADLLKTKRAEYNLGAVQIQSPPGAAQLSFRDASLEGVSFPELEAKVTREVLRGNEATKIQSLGKGDLIRALVPIFSPQ